MPPLRTHEESRLAKHEPGVEFECSVCRAILPVGTNGGTGYGVDPETDLLVCYACCGVQDRARMIETGRATLYLSSDRLPATVSNWPGTLTFPVTNILYGRHNIAGRRYDVYFRLEGFWWHGVQYGDNTQIVHCKRTKQTYQVAQSA